VVVVVVDVVDVVVLVEGVVVDAVVSTAPDVATTADVVALDESGAPTVGSIAAAWLQAVNRRQPPMSQPVPVARTGDTLQR
jgi:hypothetical protein